MDMILGILSGESYSDIRVFADLSVCVKYTNSRLSVCVKPCKPFLVLALMSYFPTLAEYFLMYSPFLFVPLATLPTCSD
jgi:hypothetical protein